MEYIITFDITTKKFAWSRNSEKLMGFVKSDPTKELIWEGNTSASIVLHYQTCCISEFGKSYSGILKGITEAREIKPQSKGSDILFTLHKALENWHGYDNYGELSQYDKEDSGIF